MVNQNRYYQISHKYAPIFAQKVSKEWTVADQIAPIDFSGSIVEVANNINKLYELRDDDIIPAKIYYSVCETTTHYFLIYAVYHILDWWKRYPPLDLYNSIRDQFDEHIHDMEGALFIITKHQDREIHVDGVVTISHKNFYLYAGRRTPIELGKSLPLRGGLNLRIVKFNESLDGNIWLDKTTQRVKLYIQSRGHGIKGDHKQWCGGDEIWYYSPDKVEIRHIMLDSKVLKRRSVPQTKTRTIKYDLVDIFDEGGLWDYRYNNHVFMQNKNGQWGFVYQDPKGRKHGGAANPPWSWNDHNDTSPIGEIATDPARFIIRYAQGWGPVSTEYIYNPYQSIGT
ncbi:MAG: hypothetical protein ACFFDN_20365 [Candidatus Hodarchaeota archaeon]